MVGSWLKYLLQRKSRYKVHSPFVYDFMCKVLNDSGSNRDYDLMLRISRLVDGKRFAASKVGSSIAWCVILSLRRCSALVVSLR